VDDAAMPDDASPDTSSTATVLDRILAAGIDRDRALAFLRVCAVVEGERMSDPDRPAPPPARVTVNAN
jgi:hypothetical protein